MEVDAVLLSHPAVAEAVAFGVPDDKYGEEVIHSHSTYFSDLANKFKFVKVK
jgi:acyl-coenzyme A synthetase/AMP-(fatty) acid ligase